MPQTEPHMEFPPCCLLLCWGELQIQEIWYSICRKGKGGDEGEQEVTKHQRGKGWDIRDSKITQTGREGWGGTQNDVTSYLVLSWGCNRAHIPLGSKYWLSSKQLVSIALQTKLLCAWQDWKASVCTSHSHLITRQSHSLQGCLYIFLFSCIIFFLCIFVCLPLLASIHQGNNLDCNAPPHGVSR